MSIAEAMKTKLTDAFAPDRLEIVDESHRHEGHAGHDGRGESHFRVAIVSRRFEGCSRVNRQRLVHQVLADELRERVHALALNLKSPQEAEAANKQP
jgi:BolA family transcriptional regulator, general stress-responsive regulator